MNKIDYVISVIDILMNADIQEVSDSYCFISNYCKTRGVIVPDGTLDRQYKRKAMKAMLSMWGMNEGIHEKMWQRLYSFINGYYERRKAGCADDAKRVYISNQPNA